MSFGGDYFSKKFKKRKKSQAAATPLGPNSVCLLLEKLDPHESVVCELVGPTRTEAEALTTCPNKSPTEYYLPVSCVVGPTCHPRGGIRLAQKLSIHAISTHVVRTQMQM
jgi:hypothetical protein